MWLNTSYLLCVFKCNCINTDAFCLFFALLITNRYHNYDSYNILLIKEKCEYNFINNAEQKKQTVREFG